MSSSTAARSSELRIRQQVSRTRTPSPVKNGSAKAASPPASPPSFSSRLLSAAELPAWMRDNDYILSHYRPQMSSALLCVRSAFLRMTNETVNVWTHFIGFVLFLILGIHAVYLTAHHAYIPLSDAKRTLALDVEAVRSLKAAARAQGLSALRSVEASRPAEAARALQALLAEHRWGLLPVLFAAAFCTAASTLFHVFWVYSPFALRLFGKIDFVGIALLCGGHAVSGIFYAFYCKPSVATGYYIAVACCCLISVVTIFSPGFHAPEARTFRACVFSSLGAAAIVPMTHAGILHGWKHDAFKVCLSWMLAAGVAYAVGAAVYATRLPECCRPGKHDRFWASHQLLHIAVIAGGLLHVFGCYKLYHYRLEMGCSASPFL